MGAPRSMAARPIEGGFGSISGAFHTKTNRACVQIIINLTFKIDNVIINLSVPKTNLAQLEGVD